MDDEDEEVIFEGHPLDQYLKDIGFRDYESETPNIQKRCEKVAEKCSISTRILLICIRTEQYSVSKKLKVVQSLWHKIDVRKYITSNWWGINRLDFTTIHEVIDIITQSRLLSEEDFNLISSLDIDKEHQRTLSWHVLPLGGLVGAVTWTLKSPLLIIGIPTLLLYAAVRLAGERYHRRCLRSVAALVGALQELQTTSKKALRRLQENELIARGFMFSVTGSSVERLENSSLPSLTRRWHTLPGLREGLLSALTAAVQSLTEATRVLVERYPLRGQLDRQQFYLAFQEADFLNTIGATCEEDGSISQEVKIDVLKVLQNCYLLLQSEFLRRLVLTFHPELRAEPSRVNPKILYELLEDISTLTKQLNTEYRIFSTYGVPRRSPSSEPPASSPPKKLKYDALFVSVHSTTLHLQNILYRTHVVEEYLETRENLDDLNSELSTPDLQTALNDILKELDMCRSCCERGISFLNTLNNPELPKNLEEEEDWPARSHSGNENIKQIHVGKTDLDPDVEDEVFEAVSTADYFDDEMDLYDSTECSRTEKQQQKNCSKLMLDELKSILVDKAKEWKEREEKALKNKRAREGICEAEIVVKETELADTVALKTEISDSQNRPVEEAELADTMALKTETSVDQSRPVEEGVKDVCVSDPVFEECQQANGGVCYEDNSSFTSEGADRDLNHRKIVGSENGKTDSNIKYSENYNVHDIGVFKVGLSSPFGLQSTPLSHRFMLKDSETFCGTGEHSSSEDSDNA
ncbi:vezatin-like isoform X1 [Schistocerca serialis cubense]|uniref:vezatin-like isoform X1 n=1 Tax=Schistocerca serialis cubense TaxID=2023355 RepID=UPI00214EF1FE|nr:vezatin-like isoform X1 [Schistocerca serialis cubense]